MPQGGRFESQVLGLDLALEQSRLRFYCGNALLQNADEQIARLRSMLDEGIAHKEQAERDKEQAERAREEAERERDALAKELAEARAEIERLKRERGG
jgi:chromosome segregation ATPase